MNIGTKTQNEHKNLDQVINTKEKSIKTSTVKYTNKLNTNANRNN